MVGRRLDWPGCVNARDLGGLPVKDGRMTRTRALFRSDGLNKLTEEGVRVVSSYKIIRIIDLRSEFEAEKFPSPFAQDPLYRNVPIPSHLDPPDLIVTLAELYIGQLEEGPEPFARAIAEIADAPPGPVAVHCYAGQDRAGVTVALTLAVAGVTNEAIAEDYSLSADNLRQENQAWIDSQPDAVMRERARRLTNTPPENMLRVLAHLDEKYGGVISYLNQGQTRLTDEQCDRLRDRLLTP